MNTQSTAVETDKPFPQQARTPMFSLIPQNLDQAMALAKLIAESDLAPKDYKSKPGNVLIAVQMGQEVGLSPMSAIQNIAVINGKPGLYGDAGKALLLSHGLIIEEDDVEVIRKTGMGRCRITRPGHPPCERTFSREAAKVAGLLGKSGPWTSYPERQMAWRAFWFAARDIASDLLRGLAGAEEIRDITERDITPMTRPSLPETPAYSAEQFAKNLPAWEKLITSGKKTAEQIIATVSSKAVLSDEQRAKINAIKKPESAAPAVTFEALEKRLREATDPDMLAADADLIRHVEDEAQQKELTDIYETRRSELGAE